ncbi:MAG: chloride channel protein, partial [Candidatus Thorarchaeota archaeon]
MKDDSAQENVAENVLPLRDLFHFDHFTHFYRLYVPASILIGLACGLVMAIFQVMIIGIGELVLLSGLPLYISPMIGGGVSGLLIYFGRREVQGSGISKAIEITHKPAALRRVTALTKLVATSISIGAGNPVGREG